MQVKDIMTRNPATARQETTLSEIAKLMQQFDTGCIPIVEADNTIVGIITDRDITVRAVAEGFDPKTTTAGQLMTRQVVCVEPNVSLQDAARIMGEKQLHRLCIVQDNKLVGILSLGDLAVTDHEDAERALEGISHGAKAEAHAPPTSAQAEAPAPPQ